MLWEHMAMTLTLQVSEMSSARKWEVETQEMIRDYSAKEGGKDFQEEVSVKGQRWERQGYGQKTEKVQLEGISGIHKKWAHISLST